MLPEIISTSAGIFSVLWLGLVFVESSHLPLGALSLPSVMVMTSFIYFYAIPVIVTSGGDEGFFGLYFSSLEWAHIVVFLYTAGAVAAFVAQRRTLFMDAAEPKPVERDMVMSKYYLLWGVAILGTVARVMMGRLNLSGSEEYEFADQPTEYPFLSEANNLMVPLTVLWMIKDNFKSRSWLLLGVVMMVFLQAGYRFRIMLLLAAVVTSFALVHRLKFRMSYTLVGTVGAIPILNLIGDIRRYGQGIDFSRISSASLSSISSLKGEAGIAYVLGYVADSELPDPMVLEPWIVGFARFVPSFMWAEKPMSTFPQYWLSGMMDAGAGEAGIAAPQEVEMLLQGGWIGLPLLAFFYFTLVVFLVCQFHGLGREARIGACALAPVFFGYYMQSRGYFFQTFVDAIFMFGPFFFVHFWGHKRSPA